MDDGDERELTTADIAQPATNHDARATGKQHTPTEIADGYPAANEGKPSPTVDRDHADVAASPADPTGSTSTLVPADEAEKFRDDWSTVQGEFVDRPREAVEHADRLVADLMQRLTAQFSETRAGLERQWDGEQDVSTEDLRVAMTRYRSFFERLLSA